MQETLTSREREIFDLLLKGISPKEIAYKLNIAYSTVDAHRSSLYRKLGVQGIQELLAKYSANGTDMIPDSVPVIENNKSASQELAQAAVPFFQILAVSKWLRFAMLAGIAALVVSAFFIGYFVGKPSTAVSEKIPFGMMGLKPNTDMSEGGNSTANVYISRETIDGIDIDEVINMEINLEKGVEEPYADIISQATSFIHPLRMADGFRFKALGDGKTWCITLFTDKSFTGDMKDYKYSFGTTYHQVITVDIPYSSFTNPPELLQQFDFNREKIETIAISAPLWLNNEFNPASIKIFDFEVYYKPPKSVF